MEDLTTELKLRVKYLEQEIKKRDEIELKGLRNCDTTIASLMIDIASYKEKLKRLGVEIKNLYDDKRITKDEYLSALEYLNK